MAGYDLGNQNCTVAVLSKHESSNFLHEYYTMPSELTFNDQKNLSFFNISQIKWLIGRKFTDLELQTFRQTFPLEVTQCPNEPPLIHGIYTRKPVSFTPTQLLAELIYVLQNRANETLKSNMVDCCIAVPVYFTVLQRKAVLDAAQKAGLITRAILHETTATALAYAFRKNDLCEIDELINVAFVDMGHTSMQICIAQFTKGKLKVLSHASSTSLGGTNFDQVLFKHFEPKIRNKYNIEVRNDVRASIKFMWQCEELKKALSSNTCGKFAIDTLMGIKGVKGSIKRFQFEKMSKPLLEPVNDLLEKALKDANIGVKSIDKVEIVGLSSCVPMIIRAITSFFGKTPSWTMKPGESIALGCAIQCNLLNGSYPSKGFKVNDILPYSIGLSWKLENKTTKTHKNFFTKGTPMPCVNYLTLVCTSTFSVDIFCDSGISERICSYKIGPFQSSSGKFVDVRVRVQLDISGFVFIDYASMMEEEIEVEVPVSEENYKQNTIQNKKQSEEELLEGIGNSYSQSSIEMIKKEEEEFEQNHDKELLSASTQGIGNSYSQSSIEMIKKEEEEFEQNHDKELLSASTQLEVSIKDCQDSNTLLNAEIERTREPKECSKTREKFKKQGSRLNEVLDVRKDEEFGESSQQYDEKKEIRTLILKEMKEIIEKAYNETHCLGEVLAKLSDQLNEEQASSSVVINKGVVNYCEFSYLELLNATNNFAKNNLIGEGAYGSVYKGFVRHTEVAIKKKTIDNRHKVKEFTQEVEILSRVRHPHLITLIGACEKDHALVYEFLPNGSLEDRLNCKNSSKPLEWKIRISIALEVCSVLIFLHSFKPHGIAHGDLKPSNILLDSNYRSKVSDFGTGRLLFENVDITTSPCHQTNILHGTIAYMDPEYFKTGVLTTQCDVYSFGLVLLKLVTWKKVKGKMEMESLRNSLEAAEAAGCVRNFVDNSGGKWSHDYAMKMIRLGLKCSEASSEKRLDLAKDVWVSLKSMISPGFDMRRWITGWS